MKKIIAQLFALFITCHTFAQTAADDIDNIAIGTKVLITEVAKKDFYFDNRADFLNTTGIVNYTLIKDKNGFYKGRIDCENGKSYNFTRVKVVIQKQEDTAAATGFDGYYASLFKDLNDNSKSLKDNLTEQQNTSSSTTKANTTYLSNFNFERFEQQILTLTADPRDAFKSIITNEDALNSSSAVTYYKTDMALEGMGTGKGKVVQYLSKSVASKIVYLMESNSYLSKEAANEMVDNMIASIKKIKTLPYKYSISEPYNVATRRLVSFTFTQPGKDINLSMDIDMTTSDESNKYWQVVVRINKY